jgi:hypothetical protein
MNTTTPPPTTTTPIQLPTDIDSKDLLIALTAAIRWRASYKDHYEGDEYNLYTLSRLMEYLVKKSE